MKTIYILFTLFVYSLGVFSQTDVSTESKKAINNTYFVSHFLISKSMTIGNSAYPFDGEKDTLDWRDWYKLDIYDLKKMSQYIEPYIGPYIRNVSLTTQDVFIANIWFNLQGTPMYITYHYPDKLHIPITVIEQMETVIEKEGKIRVTPIGTFKPISYIQIEIPINLKQLQTRLYHPVAPSWNDDIAIQLDNVFPTATYYADNLSSRSHVSICPGMFDYTENSSATQGNIYISGIGEVAFTLSFVNLTDRDIVLDLGKIRAKMDDGSNHYPEISYISINGGSRIDKYRTVELESEGGNIGVTFYFESILDMSPYWYGTYLGDYKLTLYYDQKNMFEHIIDERYDYDIFDTTSLTWYREGYIMFRYMYNKDKIGMFYNKTTDTYFY